MLCFLICGSSKRLCGFFCCECDEEPIDYDEETYDHLSSRRRQELENLRSIAILRCLARFTMTLKEENMTKRLPDTNSQHLDNEDGSGEVSSDLGGTSNGEEGGEQNNGTGDIEMGTSCHDVINNDSDAVVDETTSNDDGDDDKYTHVLVPHPSYDIRGAHVKELEECSSDDDKNNTPRRRMIFFRKPKEQEEDGGEDKEESGEEDKKEVTDDDDEEEEDSKEPEVLVADKRSVPIFCAVCLMEYDISERVCWASNGECTHVFHEDCIVQWLTSLGRKRSNRQSFPRNPSEMRLLDYDLSCPCCRQPFISINLILAPSEEEADENVLVGV